MIIFIGSDKNHKITLSIHIHYYSPFWLEKWKQNQLNKENIVIKQLRGDGPLFDIYTFNQTWNFPFDVVNIQNAKLIIDFANQYNKQDYLNNSLLPIDKIEQDYLNEAFFRMIVANIAGYVGHYISIVSSEHLSDVLFALNDLYPPKNNCFTATEADIDDIKTIIHSRDYTRKYHPPGKVLFEEFKQAHHDEYQKLCVHDRIFSKAHQRLTQGIFTNLSHIKEYVEAKPSSTTARLLKRTNTFRYDDQKKQIINYLEAYLDQNSVSVTAEYLGFNVKKTSYLDKTGLTPKISTLFYSKHINKEDEKDMLTTKKNCTIL